MVELGVAWYDAVGIVGVGLILVAYALLRAGRVRGDALSYQLLNLFGALAVLVSLVYEFNLSAVLMETAWVLVSPYGIVRGWRARIGSPGRFRPWFDRLTTNGILRGPGSPRTES